MLQGGRAPARRPRRRSSRPRSLAGFVVSPRAGFAARDVRPRRRLGRRGRARPARDASPGAESMARFASATVSDADVAEDVLADARGVHRGRGRRLDWLAREARRARATSRSSRARSTTTRTRSASARLASAASATTRAPRSSRSGRCASAKRLGAGRRERARPDRERARVQAPKENPRRRNRRRRRLLLHLPRSRRPRVDAPRPRAPREPRVRPPLVPRLRRPRPRRPRRLDRPRPPRDRPRRRPRRGGVGGPGPGRERRERGAGVFFARRSRAEDRCALAGASGSPPRRRARRSRWIGAVAPTTAPARGRDGGRVRGALARPEEGIGVGGRETGGGCSSVDLGRAFPLVELARLGRPQRAVAFAPGSSRLLASGGHAMSAPAIVDAFDPFAACGREAFGGGAALTTLAWTSSGALVASSDDGRVALHDPFQPGRVEAMLGRGADGKKAAKRHFDHAEGFAKVLAGAAWAADATPGGGGEGRGGGVGPRRRARRVGGRGVPARRRGRRRGAARAARRRRRDGGGDCAGGERAGGGGEKGGSRRRGSKDRARGGRPGGGPGARWRPRLNPRGR